MVAQEATVRASLEMSGALSAAVLERHSSVCHRHAGASRCSEHTPWVKAAPRSKRMVKRATAAVCDGCASRGPFSAHEVKHLCHPAVRASACSQVLAQNTYIVRPIPRSCRTLSSLRYPTGSQKCIHSGSRAHARHSTDAVRGNRFARGNVSFQLRLLRAEFVGAIRGQKRELQVSHIECRCASWPSRSSRQRCLFLFVHQDPFRDPGLDVDLDQLVQHFVELLAKIRAVVQPRQHERLKGNLGAVRKILQHRLVGLHVTAPVHPAESRQTAVGQSIPYIPLQSTVNSKVSQRSRTKRLACDVAVATCLVSRGAEQNATNVSQSQAH